MVGMVSIEWFPYETSLNTMENYSDVSHFYHYSKSLARHRKVQGCWCIFVLGGCGGWLLTMRHLLFQALDRSSSAAVPFLLVLGERQVQNGLA